MFISRGYYAGPAHGTATGPDLKPEAATSILTAAVVSKVRSTNLARHGALNHEH